MLTNPPPRPRTACGSFWPLGLAVAVTLLNAIKPLQVDDAAYFYYAAQIAEHPTDPYGFEMFWFQWPQPASAVLAPPLLPAWWAVAIRLFGDQPLAWKLWLFPFVVLFTFSLQQLFRRFARGLETPLLVMTVLSPVFLPSWNLMLDVPALALSLASVVLLLRACENGSLGRVLLAGLLAGLAIQTKYTGLLAPAVMLLATWTYRRWGPGVGAACTAGLLFMVWEGFVAWRYGESHFLYHLRAGVSTLADKIELTGPLVSILGGVAPYLALLALTALGARRIVLVLGGAAILLGYGLLAVIPAGRDTLFPYLLFGVFGMGVLAGAVLVVKRLTPRGREEWFLVLWLGLEAAGYFALTPFPAARRVMGLVVVLTLLAGRLAARPGPRNAVWGISAFSTLLGCLFAAVDLRDAVAQMRAAEAAAASALAHTKGTAWYVGHWGFQFYAERAGLRPVVPDDSLLRAGDWLIVPEERFEQQTIFLPSDAVAEQAPILLQDVLPLRTVRGYYGGAIPLEPHAGPRIVVHVYRVQSDFVPSSRR